MTKMRKKMRRNSRKNVKWMAAAVLTAALLSGQVMPSAAADTNKEISVSTIIPENITIESPVPLSEISLPESEYGKLSWADDSLVPTKRSEAFEVVFSPSDSFDLSRVEDWDGESEKITGYITVVVSSISKSEENEETFVEEDAEYNGEEQAPQDGETKEEINTDQTENADDMEEAVTEEAAGDEQQETEEPKEEEEEAETPQEDNGQTEEEQSEEEGTADSSEEVPAQEDITENGQEGEVSEEEESSSAEAEEASGDSNGEEEQADSDQSDVQADNEEGSASEEDTDTGRETEDNTENIFDRVNEEVKDERPVTAEDDLTEEEMQQRAQENHSCNGIYVSGINLPWYVQFRATSGESYEFSNESHANIFRSYEFELWDLKNDTEYVIPEGEYISVTIPVKEGYAYTVEHLLDNGATETIIPSVEGSTMIFSTHSFSPFGIAGSRPLVGEELPENTYLTPTPTAAPTKTPSRTPNVSNNTITIAPGNTGSNTGEPTKDRSGYSSQTATPTPEVTDNSSSGNGSDSSGETDNSRNTVSQSGQNSTSANAVKTGDNTRILPFVILVAAAVVIIAAVLFLKKKKK